MSDNAAPHGRAWPKASSPALMLIGVGLTSALAPLSASVLLVALPDLQRDLALDATSAGILVSVYLAAMVFLQPVGGRLGDSWGRRRALLAGIALFAGASLLGTSASGYGVLVTARLLQAAGGSLAFPNAFAVVRDSVPAKRRGRVLGLVGASMVVTSAAGVPLGALTVTLGGWRATFALTAALAALTFLAVQLYVLRPQDAQPVCDGAEHESSQVSLEPRRGRHSVGAAVLSLGATNSAMYAFLVGISVASGTDGGARACHAWLLFTLLGASIIGAAAGGHVADHLGRRRPAAWGLGVLAVGFIPMLSAGAVPMWMDMGGSALAGLGAGAAMTSLQTVAADTATGKAGRTAGALASARYVGAAIGSGLAAVAGSRSIDGLAAAPLVAMASTLAAIMAAGWLFAPSLAGIARWRGEAADRVPDTMPFPEGAQQSRRAPA